MNVVRFVIAVALVNAFIRQSKRIDFLEAEIKSVKHTVKRLDQNQPTPPTER
ncbi:hypothetical protein ACLPJK_26745 [Pseudomonas aeruginosa]|uniref:hypothetical protein n=1 Tax=Pseudomonas aeruginosa TaxID=287 RepID=UPI003D2AADAA